MIFRVGTTVTCALVLAVAWAYFDGAVEAKDKKDKKKRRGGPQPPPPRGVRGSPSKASASPPASPSPGLRHLFVVGDEGTLAELDENGRPSAFDPLPGTSRTGVSIRKRPARLLVEDPPGLVVYDPATRQGSGASVWTSRPPLQSSPPGRQGTGLRGLPPDRRAARGAASSTWRPARAGEGGRRGSTLPCGNLDNASVVTAGRWTVPRLAAISYEASLGPVPAHRPRPARGPDAEGKRRVEYAVPAVQPEGVCLDGRARSGSPTTRGLGYDSPAACRAWLGSPAGGRAGPL